MPFRPNRLEGHKVSSAKDGVMGLALAVDGSFDLIVLDIMPRSSMDSRSASGCARQVATLILVLTARKPESTRSSASSSADRFVTKPFSSRELLSRIKAILRRAKEPHPGIDSAGSATSRSTSPGYEAKNGRLVSLTALEFTAPVPRPVKWAGRPSNDVLTMSGADVFVDPRTVDKHISLLRRKFEDDPQEPNTSRASGRRYKLTIAGVHGIFIEQAEVLNGTAPAYLSGLSRGGGMNHEKRDGSCAA
jgi:DNA-binding response OmpR family regulator